MRTCIHQLCCALLIIPATFRTGHTQTLQYDTTILGSGNGFYEFSFPKFNPTLGTLTEIEISTTVTLEYNFTLENKENVAIPNYRVRIVREDEIDGDALSGPLNSSTQKNYGFYNLAATDGVPGSGADFVSVGPVTAFNHINNSYTMYNTGDYLGSGTVDFTYLPMTYSIVFGGSTYSFGGNSSDETNFSLTYHYIPTVPLEANITFFSAQKKQRNAVEIKWKTENERNDRRYEIQKSSHGKPFTRVAQLPAAAGPGATGSYSYTYPVQSTDATKLTFRLKQVDANGAVTYSPLRFIELEAGSVEKPRLYPNPSFGAATLLFSNSTPGDWEVQVFAADGKRVSGYFFTNVLEATINNTHELGKGIYLVKAINKQNSTFFVQRLLIQ